MNEYKIDLKSGRLLPWQFQFFGFLLLIAAIAIFRENIFISGALLVVSILIFTASSGIEFNTEEKTYRPYNSFLFLKKGRSIPYGEVEMMYVNANKVSQRIYSYTSQSSVFKNVEFDAYIKFSDGKKEYLLTKKDKNMLISQLEPVAKALGVQILDNTQ